MSPLSSLLVRDQIVGVRRIEEALQRQVVHGGDLETNLLELGAVSEDVLAQYRAQLEGLGSVPSAQVMNPDSEAAELLTPELAERHRMIPLRIDGTRLLVAVASPPAPGTLDELSFLLSLDFVPRIATELRIAAALAHVFGIPMAPRFARLAEKLGPVSFDGVARGHVVTVSGSREIPNKVDDRVVALVGGKRPSERMSPVPEPPKVVGPPAPSKRASALPEPRVVELAAPSKHASGLPETPVESALPEPPMVVEPTAPPRDEETERVFTPVPRQPPAPRRRRKVGPTVAAELLEGARTRDEVLEILLEVAHQTLDYVAIFAVQEDSADGRAAIGDGTPTERLRTISIPLGEPSFVRMVRDSRSHYLGPIHDEGSNHAVLRKLGRPPPANAMVMPIVLRSRIVLMVYGDSGRRPTTGEDIVDLLALAPRVAAAFQRLILARKFTGYSPAEKPSLGSRSAPPRGEIVSKRPSITIGPSEPPPPAALPGVPASSAHTWTDPAAPAASPSAPADERARASAESSLAGVIPLPSVRPQQPTVRLAVPPDPTHAEPAPAAPASSRQTQLGIPAIGIPEEARGLVETVQMSVAPDARDAETAPIPTDASPDDLGHPDATTVPAPPPVTTTAPVRVSETETTPLPVERPSGPPASSVVSPPEIDAKPTADTATAPGAQGSGQAPANGDAPASEVDTGPIAKGSVGETSVESPEAEVDTGPNAKGSGTEPASEVLASELDTVPLPTAATPRPIPETSEIPTGEGGEGDEPELTVSPWTVGDGSETFTPVPRVADTIGAPDLDPSSRPTDPAPPFEDRPRQPPELGPVSGSSVGRRRAHHDAFRVDVLTPLPVSDQPVPSVIVDMGPNIESLVDSLVRGGEEGDLAAAALQKIGEAAIPALVQRFPGPLAFDRHSPHTRLPRVGECGPILRLLPGFRQHAVPYLLPLVSSPAPEARFYATFLFSELQYPEAIPHLAPLLWDADHQIRILAIDVLKGFRRFQEFAALTKELRKTAWDASLPIARRRVATEAIGELRDAGAVALLVELLGHEDPQLSELCWRSLVLITRQDFGQAKKKWQHWLQKEGSRHHVEWLIDALVHPSPELRLGASEELKRITKEYFGYYYNLPRRDREKARKRYLEWWDRIGRARFTGQRA